MSHGHSFSTLVTVRDGKLKLLEKLAYEQGLSQFMDGQELVLTIEEVERKRTSAQNRFFHGPICRAFMPLGYRTVQEAKDMLALLFIPQDLKQIDGSIVRVPGHTSSLSVKAFNDFIEQCIQLAAENDIYIKDADQWRADHQKASAA